MSGLFTGIEQWAVDVLVALGYPGIALLVALETIIPPIPSEVILPMAGFQVAEGQFAYPLVVLAATGGSLAGALILYGLGFWLGAERLRRFVERTGHYVLIGVSDLDRSERWFARHGGSAVLVARLVPGMRSLISLPAGLTRMSLPRFVLFTLLGSAAWNAVLVGLGWMLGTRWDLVGQYLPVIEYGVLALFIALLVRFLWRRLRRRTERGAAPEMSPVRGGGARPP